MRNTMLCAVAGALLPLGLSAEPVMSGDVTVGYGAIGSDAQAYGIANVDFSDTKTFENGNELTYKLGVTLRSDAENVGYLDDEALDFSLEFNGGAAGKFGLTTFNTISQKPWADGELFNRGSVNTFPTIRPRYDDVTGSVTNVNGDKVDPDLVVTYSNSFGRLGVDMTANPLETFDGFDASEISGTYATFESKFTLPTSAGIYSFKVNDLNDYLLSVVYPIRSAGVTLIANRQINEGDWANFKQELIAVWNTQNMGLFKGGMAIHAFDASEDISLIGVNFGDDTWDLKVARDTQGDYAIEGSYALAENIKLLGAYDNGHAFFEGFDDANSPPPSAAARDAAWELAVSFTF